MPSTLAAIITKRGERPGMPAIRAICCVEVGVGTHDGSEGYVGRDGRTSSASGAIDDG